MAKRVIFEHRSGAYLRVREHRSAKKCSLQPGIMRNATVVLEPSPETAGSRIRDKRNIQIELVSKRA
ncbi:hypothetical protein Q644_19830 [Brucella intermedia 229E]|uniref:Uncharacterized protein n=1 Tax=Brucella intermedia 229E TaxID=1337887 RepID=U4V9W2_9HYPH|nr:hypothetical protein Q644_19830 [Brucella intermedia 229E]OOC52263.1 hypothetical protein AS855_00165 [Brucella intermedia M86]